MREQTEQTYKERILRVLVHIQNHLDEAISLDDLAKIAHFSPCHFHRIFRGMVGETVMQHVRRLRLERATHQLRVTDLPVTRLAFEAGYETHESFTRAFRAMFGVAPSHYRENMRHKTNSLHPDLVHFAPDGHLDNFEPHVTGDSKMDVRIETLKPMRVAFMRHTGPYADCGPTWEALCGWAGRHGLFGPDTVILGLSHDDPEVTPAEKIRYDACITVGDNVEAEGDVGIQEIGGVECAVTTHKGPYEKLADSYARFCGEWLAQSGREMVVGPSIEIYRNNPEDTPPEELLTEIYLPLK